MKVQIKVYVSTRAELEQLIRDLQNLSMAYVVITEGMLDEGARI